MLFAQDIRVTSPVPALIFSSGGRVTWGIQNNLLAFDSLNANGYYDVYTSRPDGTNVVCLTCGATQLPAYNKGNPEWHPQNQFLAVQIQTVAAIPTDSDFSFYTPGVGVGNDLYIMDAAGQNYWPVTQGAKGVLHPRFSHDGTKLLWVQRGDGNFWNLMLGDFAVVNGAPLVTNIQALPPCANNDFCETGGFTTDDSTVLFTGNLDGQPTDGIDIYSYNLTTGVLTNLTNSPNNWDEFATAMPNSNKIVWMTGAYSLISGLKTDYWMMDADGSNKVQLTFFNDSEAPSWALGFGVSCAKFNWSPDGTQMASYFIPTGKTIGQSGSIYVITYEPAAPTLSAASFARPPLSAESVATTFYPNLATGSGSAFSTVLPLSLAGTTISVTDSLGAVRAAPLFFVSPSQVNWEMPAGTAEGPATVQFLSAANVSVRDTINVQNAAPGLFTANAQGSGAPAGYVLRYPAGSITASVTQNAYDCSSGTCVAAAISLGSATDSAYLILYGTGVRYATSVAVNINGQSYPVAFSGAQGTYPGLDQVNVLLPQSLAGTGQSTLYLVADGVTSNTINLLIQ